MTVNVWVAGDKDTVCDRSSVCEMQKIMPSTRVRKFSDASHSIHNTAQSEVVDALKSVIDEAARRRRVPLLD